MVNKLKDKSKFRTISIDLNIGEKSHKMMLICDK